MLTQKDIEEFRTLYKNHFGKEISNAEAYEQGTRLLNMLRIVYKPIPKSAVEDPHKL
jgi:hypothetical protein